MSLLTTFADILTLADIYSHRTGDTGAVNRESRRRVIVHEFGGLHTAMLTLSSDGYGLGHRELTQPIVSQVVKLPVDYLGLTYLERGDRPGLPPPFLVLPSAAQRRGYRTRGRDPGGSGAYYVEGPGREFDENLQALVDYPQQLRMFPEVPVGTVITVGYKSQPPSWGDPTDDNDDVIQVDMIAQPMLDFLVTAVRIVMASREEAAELQRGQGTHAQAVARVSALKGKQDRSGVVDADQFGHDVGRTGGSIGGGYG